MSCTGETLVGSRCGDVTGTIGTGVVVTEDLGRLEPVVAVAGRAVLTVVVPAHYRLHIGLERGHAFGTK